MDLEQNIRLLNNRASEGEYRDIKQQWYNNNAGSIKDIICMANNTTSDMQDGYIIISI